MVLVVVLIVAGLLTVVGCAVQPGGESASQANPSPGSARPTAPSPSPGEQVLVGVLVEGIRPTCRVLDTGTRRFALVGPGTQALREGDRVTAVGTPRPDLVSPCGLAFAVRALTVG